MQSSILPAPRRGGAPPGPPWLLPVSKPFPYGYPSLPRFSQLHHPQTPLSSISVSPANIFKGLSSPHFTINYQAVKPLAFSPIAAASYDEADTAKLAQVSKRLKYTSRHFKRLGSFGFWGQLICSVVASVILSFSTVITGKVTSPATFYATAGGIAAAFLSVFWSFGHIRLADKLRRTADNPSKAPPRADVVRSLNNGIVVNLLGMGAAILGMLATVGVLVAKALTGSVNPYYQGIPPGSSPVLALDVFLVQASANTILSHFLGLVCSLELLRTVTVSPAGKIPIPMAA
ncbi:protein TIC 21, chloroplastic-like [Henckelia pumila]|uniref:protein TIC 21, chloroplastic-like n=1 Tax=Henckelia pumila TaxID=405737 RepID=UPI003C6E4208